MERVVSIPTQSGEVVSITSSELRDLPVADVLGLLQSEDAEVAPWYGLVLEYWRLGENKHTENKDGRDVCSKFELLLRDALKVGALPFLLRGAGSPARPPFCFFLFPPPPP